MVQYTSDDPPSEDADWKELIFHDPDDVDDETHITIDGENFNPDSKYSMKITARGEIDGPPCDPIVFTTGDGSELGYGLRINLILVDVIIFVNSNFQSSLLISR